MTGVSAIVLAAGESRRMGAQKALLDWRGMPLIQYQLEQLASIDAIAEIIVVTGHAPERIEAIVAAHSKARAVRNARYASGKVSSILAGVRAVDSHAGAILLCAVDQPRPAGVISHIIRERRMAIAVPTHAGHRGHPLLFDAALRGELLAIDEASMGVRAVVERDSSRVQEIAFEDPVVVLDLNRPGDVPAPERGGSTSSG